MRRFSLVVPLVVILAVLAAAGPVLAEGLAGVQVQPETIDVGTFFTGGRLTVTGRIPERADLVVAVAGPAVNAEYDLKGRLGPFWMTRGKVELENAPNMYILLLPRGEEWARRLESLGLGLKALEKDLSISAADMSPDEIFNMFVALKESEKLYAEIPGAVTYAAAADGSKGFTAACDLPSSVTPGEYTVRITAMENGERIGEESRTLTVREVGFIQFVHHLATDRRLTYGVLAVIIALLTGSAMGLLFKSGGGH